MIIVPNKASKSMVLYLNMIILEQPLCVLYVYSLRNEIESLEDGDTTPERKNMS